MKMANRSDGVDFPITTGRDGSRSFGEHDDRWAPRGKSNRRYFRHYGKGPRGGSYNRGGPNRGRGGYPFTGRPYGPNARSCLEDDEGDVMMGGEGGGDVGPSRRFNPYGSRSNNRHSKRYDKYQHALRNNPNNKRVDPRAMKRFLPLDSSGKSWHQVRISHAKRVPKTTLLGLIAQHVPEALNPFHFHHEGETVVFYVCDQGVADELQNLSRKITLPDSNMKLVIYVKLSGPPMSTLDDRSKQKLKEVMSQRYDASVKVLDLTMLYEDKDLHKEGLYLALNRQNVVENVIKIIHENIPELVGLNLSQNKLMSLSPLQDLVNKAPHITSLNLSNNQLKSIEELEKVKGWLLVELVLEGNPLCDQFRNKKDSYFR